MPDLIRETERYISSSGIFGRRRPLLVGRGATALMLLYETLSEPGGRIVLPAIGCPSMLATVLLTGRKPVIVDVDSNLNIDPERVGEIIQPGDVVVGVHIFGIPCEIGAIEKICKENGAILIEDAAQAVGGRIDGRPVGTFGRASILSFANGKILPTNGGGAILADDEQLLAKLEKLIAELPDRPDDLAVKARRLRDVLTDAFNETRRDRPEAASEWVNIYRDYSDIFSFTIQPDETEDIVRALHEMNRIAEKRRDGLGWYYRNLDIPGVEVLQYPELCSPYRFTFMLPGLTGSSVQDCTEAIRAGGMHASNLYLPLHWLAPDEVIAGPCPRAEAAGTRVINLWLEDGIPERDASRVAAIVGKWTG